MIHVQSIESMIVIGAGNWGLTLASVFAPRMAVRVWTIDRVSADRLRNLCTKDELRFRGFLPDSVVIEEKFATDIDPRRCLIVMAVPSSQVRAVACELGRHARDPLILCVSKGFDAERQCTMSEVIRQEIPGASVVVLTGPTIANEIARGKPTRAVLAGDNLIHLAMVKQALRNNLISFEVSRYPTHHEICAALKGIVAIAAGLADGLELGANVQGVLLTEGLRELAVVASFFGIPESVAYGVSGAGDLFTTCISPDSRNRQLGTLLARGRTLREALDEVGMTVEGVAMSRTIETLWSLDVSIPLFHLVNAMLRGETRDARAEITALIGKER